MNLTTETTNEQIVVRVGEDRIDAASAIQFKERMREIIATPSTKVLIDMTRVTFLDSSGLGAIVSVMKLLGPDRKMELAALSPTVEKVFRLTRMNTFLTIHPSAPAPAPNSASPAALGQANPG